MIAAPPWLRRAEQRKSGMGPINPATGGQAASQESAELMGPGQGLPLRMCVRMGPVRDSVLSMGFVS